MMIVDAPAGLIFRDSPSGSRKIVDGGDRNPPGSLGSHLVSQIVAALTGKIAPTFTVSSTDGGGLPTSYAASSAVCDMFIGGGNRNTAGWWGSIDLTAIPLGGLPNGSLITRRDMLNAGHSPPGIGATVTFQNRSNAQFPYTVRETAFVAGTDICVATLDRDVDVSITPLQLLPASYAGYLPHPQYGYPAILTNQDRRLLIADIFSFGNGGGEIQISQSTNPAYGPWFYPPRVDDSGSPGMLLINGSLVNIFNFHSAGTGPSDADNIAAINAAIAANWTAAGFVGTPPSVSTVNLGAFSTF